MTPGTVQKIDLAGFPLYEQGAGGLEAKICGIPVYWIALVGILYWLVRR